MLMYQWWPFSWLTVCYKLVCCRKNTNRNARKSGSKKSSVNTTLHLIFSDRFQKLNMQNLKYQYNSFLCTAQHIDVNFFLCNVVRKIKPPGNPEKWTLGRINSHSFNNILSRFSGTRNEKKLHTDNYCTSFNVKLAFFTVFVLTLQTSFAAHCCFLFFTNDSSTAPSPGFSSRGAKNPKEGP